jgi:hypothetical protein
MVSVKQLFLVVAGLVGVAAVSKAKAVAVPQAVPRNVRNKNPGNLRRGADKWVGLISPGTDAEYCQFDTMKNGWRAAGITLLNYQRRHGLNTLRGIITRWAPAPENDTDGYIAFVAKRLGQGPDDYIDVRTRLKELLLAIATREGGTWSANDPELDAGVSAAKAAV